MRAFEFRRYLVSRNYSEADIKTHIDNVRHVEKAIDKTADNIPSRESAESQIKWHVFPWKRKDLLDSLSIYLSFKSSYRAPSFVKIKKLYKECPECGGQTPLGSTFCKNCGAAIGRTQFFQINAIYDSVEDKWNNHRVVVITVAAVIAAAIIAIAFNIITAFSLFDVVDKEAKTAYEMLVESGIQENKILFECEGESIDKDVALHGEYVVISQLPEAGAKVHKSSRVTLSCKDLFAERTSAISGCRYSSYDDAVSTAEKYGYKWKTENVDGSREDRDQYIFSVDDQNDTDKSVTFVLDSREHIEKWIKDEAKDYIGKSFSKVKKLKKVLGCAVEGLDYYDYPVEFEDDEYMITGFNSFSFKDKKLIFNVDSEYHLEELDYIEKLKDKIPFKGMPEDYIDDTGAGEHTSESDDEESGTTEYIWKSKDGKYDVLKVICEDYEVTEVHKLSKEIFWNNDLPDYSADGDAYYAEQERIEEEKEAALREKAEEYATEARDRMSVFYTRSGTYHISGCGDLMQASWSGETTYGVAKNRYHACMHCNPDTYCERSFDDFVSEYMRNH